MIRLNKYLSENGICSRREADRLIAAGHVKVDNVTAAVGMRIDENAVVMVDDLTVNTDNKPVYIAFNKPCGIVCTSEVREGYTNIYEYLNLPFRVFSIGRLDKESEGLLLLTNQGDAANELMKSRNGHEKEYIVTVDKDITSAFLDEMSSGVHILDTITKPCKIKKIGEHTFDIVLTQGLNRQIRRMCEELGFKVLKLKRIRFVTVHLGDLKTGEYRNLTEQEVSKLINTIN